jgi:hypothetical protein
LLIVHAERKRIIFTVNALCAILAEVDSFVLPTRYTGHSYPGDSPAEQFTCRRMASQLGSLGSVALLASDSLSLKNPNDMFVGMLKSSTVEDAMEQHYDLMQEYRKRYHPIIRIRQGKPW